MATMRRASVTLVLALCALSFPDTASRAQAVPDLKNSTHLGLGYVASIPGMFIGITALGVTPGLLGGAGLYADVRFTHDSPGKDPYYRSDISVEEAEGALGDLLFQEKGAWVSVDLAVVYSLTRDFALYAGGGYLREEQYIEYYDDTEQRGFEGFYWVKDDTASGTRINVIGGMLFRASRYVLFQMGAESRPGAMAGIILTLPL